MVEERHPALDRGRHAHLVPHHQEVDEVRLEIRVTHPIEIPARRLRVALERLLIRIARGEQRRIGEKALLERGRKDREVLVEEMTRTGRQTEERAGRVAPEPARQTAERAADAPAKSRWREPPIDTAQAGVPARDPVALIAEEH